MAGYSAIGVVNKEWSALKLAYMMKVRSVLVTINLVNPYGTIDAHGALKLLFCNIFGKWR